MKLYFPLQRVRLLNKWKCTYECYLCLLARLFFPSIPMPLHRAVEDVQFVSVFVITWLKGKILLRNYLLSTQLVMLASFKGAIVVNLFSSSLAVNVPSKGYLCDAKLTTPVAYCICKNTMFKVGVNFSTIFKIQEQRFSAQQN